MSRIGDSPAHHCQHVRSPGSEVSYGMTYRQWLIGQAVAGILADPGVSDLARAATSAIAVADHIIRQLDEEEKK